MQSDSPITHQRALAYIHVAAVLFGLTGVFGEVIQAGAVVITLGRALFAVASLGLMARLQGRPILREMNRRRYLTLLGSGALLAVHWVTFFVSVKVGGIAVATLGFASFPAFITLCEALFFKERIGLLEWLLLGLVSFGLVLVTPSFDFADEGTIGLVWGLLSGLSFALLAISNRYAARGIDPLQVSFWQNIAVALCALPFSLGAIGAVSPSDWFWLALLGVFCTGLSHFLFVSSLARLNARTAGLVIALEPVYAIAFAWALFAQQPSARMMIGALLIIAASVISSRRKSG